jgi:hypothetical protein
LQDQDEEEEEDDDRSRRKKKKKRRRRARSGKAQLSRPKILNEALRREDRYRSIRGCGSAFIIRFHLVEIRFNLVRIRFHLLRIQIQLKKFASTFLGSECRVQNKDVPTN